MENYVMFKSFCAPMDMHIAGVQMTENNFKLIDEGVSLIKTIDEIEVTIKNLKGLQNDFLVYSSSFPVVSARVMNYFLNIESDKHYLEFFTIKTQKKLQTSYYFMNITQNIDAIDRKMSEYSVFPDFMGSKAGKIKSINKLVLDESLIGNRNIFRLTEMEPYVIISEKLVEEIKKQSFTGYRIESPIQL